MTTEDEGKGQPLHLVVSTPAQEGTHAKRGRGGNFQATIGAPWGPDDTRDIVFTTYRDRQRIEALRVRGNGRIELLGQFVGLDLATHRRLQRWLTRVQASTTPPTGNGQPGKTSEAAVDPSKPVRVDPAGPWMSNEVSSLWGVGDGDPPGDLEFRDYSGLVYLKLAGDTYTWSGQLPREPARPELTPNEALYHFAHWVAEAHLATFGRMP